MGAHFDWRPTKGWRPLQLSMAPSRIVKALALGDGPRTFSRDDLPFLRGMVAAGMSEIGELIDLIETHDEIEARRGGRSSWHWQSPEGKSQ